MNKILIVSWFVVCGILVAWCAKNTSTEPVENSQQTWDLVSNNTQMVECNEAVETYLENTSDQGSGPEIQAGDTIAVDYIGRLEAGEVFDTSVESVARACDSYNEARDYNAWLEFTVGAGQMIAWFDAWVQEMQVWETKTITIPAAQAYGERSEDALTTFPKEEIPDADQYVVGQQLVWQYGQQFTVYKVTPTEIIFDQNHPLAGKDLIFDITIKQVN